MDIKFEAFGPVIVAILDGISGCWNEAKTFVEHMIGFSNDAIHILAGVCIQLLIAALLRVSLRSLKPWLVVLTIQILNEASDLWLEVWPSYAMQWGESAKDVLLTMGLPTLLLLVARFKPALLHRELPDSGAIAEGGIAPPPQKTEVPN